MPVGPYQIDDVTYETDTRGNIVRREPPVAEVVSPAPISQIQRILQRKRDELSALQNNVNEINARIAVLQQEVAHLAEIEADASRGSMPLGGVS